MSEQGEAVSNTMPAVCSAPLFSYREENTGCVVSLLSSSEPGRLQWNDPVRWQERDKITFTNATEDTLNKV